MMKRTVLLLLTMAMLLGAASAQTLPGIALFSPGLVKLAQLEAQDADISAQAQIGVSKAMYARDLSVLGAMLEGTTFGYARSGEDEALTIERGGELLGAYSLEQADALDALNALPGGAAVLERAPLDAVAGWLESLAAGDVLAGGFAVSQPFVLERTMSDDGTRLTRIDVSGAIARADGAPWTVTGFLRQPAGRAPKDTFELTIRQDEDNFIELSYSALRQNVISRKDKAGNTTVGVTLKAAGRLGGYGITSRLIVNMKNEWTADGEALSERVTISATLTHQDKTPGRRMSRLNSVNAKTKNTITLTTHETENETVELRDKMTVQLTMDDNETLNAQMDMTLRAGGLVALPQGLEVIDHGTAAKLAARIYAQLGEKTKETIQKGL